MSLLLGGRGPPALLCPFSAVCLKLAGNERRPRSTLYGRLVCLHPAGAGVPRSGSSGFSSSAFQDLIHFLPGAPTPSISADDPRRPRNRMRLSQAAASTK